MLPSLTRLLPEFTPNEAVAYSPTPGNRELRSLWKQEMERKNPSLKEAQLTDPLVTAGLTNGLFQLGELFVDSGDQVVIPDLMWGNYRLIFEQRRQATIRTFPFFNEREGFGVDAFRQAINEAAPTGKIVTILNFPNNPAGYVPTEKEAAAVVGTLEEAAKAGTDVLAICDDAYFGLVYEEDALQESLFALLARCHPRLVAAKVDGATKEEYMWGLRIGFLTLGSPELNDERAEAVQKKIMGSLRSSISNANTLGQHALCRLLKTEGYREEKESQYEELRQRYLTVRRLLRERENNSRLRPLPFNAGYFLTLQCTGVDAEALRQLLLDRGIGTISIGSSYLRVAFAAVDEPDLAILVQEIYQAAEDLAES